MKKNAESTGDFGCTVFCRPCFAASAIMLMVDDDNDQIVNGVTVNTK